MSIFQKSILKQQKQDESLVALRWADFQNYLAKVESIRDFKEEEYQDGFLRDVFENDKKELLEIQAQINKTDKETDAMVYKLYDLTDEEIKIVEGGLIC